MLVIVNFLKRGPMFTERQLQIIQVTMDIIVRQGTQKLTIRNLAEAIGVSEPAVYRHFTSKHALLVSLLEHLQASIAPVFNTLHSGNTSFTHAVETFLHTLFSTIEANPAYASIVFTEEAFHSDNNLRPLLKDILSGILAKLETAIGRFQSNASCRTDLSSHELAKMMLGAIRLTITQWHLEDREAALTLQAQPLANTLSALYKP
jgi:AcrR family transcriptional regulator